MFVLAPRCLLFGKIHSNWISHDMEGLNLWIIIRPIKESVRCIRLTCFRERCFLITCRKTAKWNQDWALLEIDPRSFTPLQHVSTMEPEGRMNPRHAWISLIRSVNFVNQLYTSFSKDIFDWRIQFHANHVSLLLLQTWSVWSDMTVFEIDIVEHEVIMFFYQLSVYEFLFLLSFFWHSFTQLMNIYHQ